MLAVLYSCVGLVNLVAFTPTIIKLLQSKAACLALSMSSWATWGVNAIISLLYGIFELGGDIPFCTVASVSIVCNSAILMLALRARWQDAHPAHAVNTTSIVAAE